MREFSTVSLFVGFSSVFPGGESITYSLYRMRLMFTTLLISVLLIFQPDASLSSFLEFVSFPENRCDQADWQDSLDRKGWSKCPRTNTFLKGLWRNNFEEGDERVGRIEFGRCCPAYDWTYKSQSAACSNAQ